MINTALIVNDDLAIRMQCEQELTSEGYEVISAGACKGLPETIVQYKSDPVIQEVRNVNYDMPVILSTAHLPLGAV